MLFFPYFSVGQAGRGEEERQREENDAADRDEAKEKEGGMSRVLRKRVEHLVFSSYVLNGTLTQRSVAVSYLLMKTYPDESPVSEKILRMFQRANEEFMPSGHFQRKYSIASVAQAIWGRLLQQDAELHGHLQMHTEDVETAAPLGPESLTKKGRLSRQSIISYVASASMPVREGNAHMQESDAPTGILASLASRDGATGFDVCLIYEMVISDNKISNSVPTSPDRKLGAFVTQKEEPLYPKCFILLRGWIETGFLSWFPEAAVVFIWSQLNPKPNLYLSQLNSKMYPRDQMTMSSKTSSEEGVAASDQFENIFIGTGCLLLQLLRDELMSAKEGLVTKLRSAGTNLRTKRIVFEWRKIF